MTAWLIIISQSGVVRFLVYVGKRLCIDVYVNMFSKIMFDTKMINVFARLLDMIVYHACSH